MTIENLFVAKVIMAWLYLVTNSLLVVGDCYAENHPHEHQTTAVVDFGLVGEHQQVLKSKKSTLLT